MTNDELENPGLIPVASSRRRPGSRVSNVLDAAFAGDESGKRLIPVSSCRHRPGSRIFNVLDAAFAGDESGKPLIPVSSSRHRPGSRIFNVLGAGLCRRRIRETLRFLYRHPGAGRDPGFSIYWMPAFAGDESGKRLIPVSSSRRRPGSRILNILDAGLRRHDE